jgi:hypothetical protein
VMHDWSRVKHTYIQAHPLTHTHTHTHTHARAHARTQTQGLTVARQVVAVHSFSDGTLMKSHFMAYIAVSEDTRVGGPNAKYSW